MIKPLKTSKKSVKTVTTKIEKPSTPMYTDLRQVMDFTRPLTIFYSGVEYESYLDILYNLGIRNFLMSYHYLQGKEATIFKKYSDIHLFIDSGAYTYMNDPKYKEYTVEQWEKQIQTYLKWAKRNKNYIFAIADLDLQYVVGYEQVYEWRKKYFEPFMLETGIPVCFIYHEDGDDYWEYMCKRYPYVGFSLNVDGGSIDEAELRNKFKIAEKHNSLVQGMASTRTSMLVDFPFYTVDSTTWNVGLKYGEISVWKGTKMSRIKKDEFESKAYPVISQYDMEFDLNLLREEDKTEMIRVNAYAFVLSERFIHERLKSKMYWFKKRSVKVDLDNIPEDFFPPVEWFSGDGSNAVEYAEKMNLNPEYNIMDMLYDVTTFLNWDNPKYLSMVEWYQEEAQQILIDQLHDTYVNRIVPDIETKIEDLRKFFSECVSGERDTLLQLGTNFDRIIKERDEYIEDYEEELVELSPEELRVKLHGLLPAPSDVEEEGAPEIDSLNEEIYRSADIVPTFDEKGRFVKGQMSVRKPKKVYSKKFPKFACDTCYAASKCPEFKSGYVCAYHKMFNNFDTRDMADIIQSVQSMVEHNMSRMQRAMVMEVLNGSIDPQVTAFIDQNMRLMNMLKQMYESGSPEVLRQTRIVRADGTQEETTQITNPQSGGILERLFSGVQTQEDTEPTKKKNERYENIEE